MKDTEIKLQKYIFNWKKIWDVKSKNIDCAITGGRKDSCLLNDINKQVLDVMKFNSDDIVLDIGCGAGQLVKKISDNVKKIIGIDISYGMLSHAEKMFNTYYIQGDMQYLPFMEKSFTKIISVSSLMYISENSLEKIFIQLDKFLLKGGYIYFGQLINKDIVEKITSLRGFHKPNNIIDLKDIIKKLISFKLGILSTHRPNYFEYYANKYGYESTRLYCLAPQTIYKDNYLHFSVVLKKL